MLTGTKWPAITSRSFCYESELLQGLDGVLDKSLYNIIRYEAYYYRATIQIQSQNAKTKTIYTIIQRDDENDTFA